jgi:hypothetical protein
MDALVRGNLRDRYEAHRIALSSGWETVSEIRRLEDLSPVDDPAASALRQPLNESDSGLASARQKADIFALLVGAGMDPSEARKVARL